MNWIGDYPEDFTTVAVYFTTYNNQGAPVAPSSAYVTSDVKIYKNGSATEKTSTNGLTMTSPFDSIVGLHRLLIDTSNDTGDSGFWTTGGGDVFSIVLSSTKTVGGQVSLKEIGSFGICMESVLRPTVARRTLDVTATGGAGIDWANVESPTTALALANTTISASASPTAAQVATAVWQDTTVGDFTTALSVGKSVMNGVALGTGLTVNAVTGLTASNLDTTVSSRLASGSYTAPSNLTAAQIATGVWQDATAGDFTTSGSIGKSLFTSGILPGASGGLFIAGTNAATTITTALTTTFTGNLTGNVGGNVTGSVGSVTGLTASNLDATISSRLASASYTAPLTAITTRSALGLAAANLDTQLLPIASLTFTVLGKLDVNVLYVNGINITGIGTSGNPWGPA